MHLKSKSLASGWAKTCKIAAENRAYNNTINMSIKHTNQ